MRKGFAVRRSGRVILVGILLIMLALTLTVKQTAKAADISSTYTWKQLKIGGGGFVTGMAIHPTTSGVMYARTDVGGAYSWNASTQTWSQMLLSTNVPNPTSSDYNVESIAVSAQNDQVVYVAVGSDSNGRILKSSNRGQSWSDSGQRWNISGNGDIRTSSERLAVDPQNDNIVYFGSRTQGLWASTNAGGSWSQVSTSQIPVGSNPGTGTPIGVKFVLFDPTSGTTNGNTSRIYVGVSGSGLYMSNDGGQSWNNIYATSDLPLAGSIASDGTLYLSIAGYSGNGSIKKYIPSSNSWSDITPGSDNYMVLSVDPFNAQRIFVGGGGVSNSHLWRTTNGGSSWDTLNLTLSSPDIPWITNTDEAGYMSAGNFLFDPLVQNKLWFAEGTGVWQATNLSDASITWNFTSKGIEEMDTTDIIAPPGGQPVSAVYDRNGFYHSNPDQYPAQPILTNKFSAGTSLDYSGGTPGFVVAASSDTRGINPVQSGYSTNGGQSWTEFSGASNYSDLFGGNIAVSATDTNNIVWLPTYNKSPYVSLDRGATWSKLGSFSGVGGLHGQVWWGAKKALDSDKVNGGVFYIYSTDNGGEFFRSSNSGQSWVQASGTAPSSSNNDSAVLGQVRAVPGQAGNVWVSTAQGGLSYTQDGGNSWTKVSAVQDAQAFGFGAPVGGASYPAIYMYGEVNNEFGIWRSTDQGTNWDLVSQYPAGIYDPVHTVDGDMNIAGRVYVGFDGVGFVYGDSSAGGTTPTPTPTPSQATIAQATTAPTIDGNSSDTIWGTAPSYNITNVEGSPTSFSASYQTAWDNHNLYFLVKVNDATYSSHNDMVEIYLDPNHDGGTSYDTTDTQYQFPSNSTTVTQYSGGNVGTNTAGVVLANATVSGGYQAEISIPWARLNMTPASGHQIGLDLDVWQNTANGKNKLFWNSTTDTDWTNPSVFGVGNITAGNTTTTTLNPSADRNNWASDTGLESTINISQYQIGYFKFDLSSISAVHSAHFRLYRPDLTQGSITLTFYQETNNSWVETSSNLPAVGAQITTAPSSTVGYVDVDVTSYIQSQFAGGVVTIAVSASCGGWQDFTSKDNGSNEPQLVIS